MTDLPVITDPRLAALPGVAHAFFTRQGGVSSGVYDSLNLGPGSKDESDAVRLNRERVSKHFGVCPWNVLSAYQVHSATALAVAGPWSDPRPLGDAVVTLTPGLVCGALSADCAPVLLADAQARVVGSAHAGWRGALGGIVQSTVDRMVELGAEPSRITAAVGPCIGPHSYEVGLDFLAAFERDAPEADRFFRPGASTDKRLFDLPAFVLDRLAHAGVTDAAWIGRDTFTDETDFYSNRRAVRRGEPDYGRLLSAIMIT